METWRPVYGWEEHYEASSLGRIRNISARRGTYPGKILKERTTRDGYLKVILQHDGVKKAAFIHRVVYEAFVAPLKSVQEIDHLDFVKTNNRLDNLEAVSRGENIQRSFDKGLDMARGSRQHRAALSEAQVARILTRVANGEKQSSLATEYGVTPTAINCIVKRKTWRHVSPEFIGEI